MKVVLLSAYICIRYWSMHAPLFEYQTLTMSGVTTTFAPGSLEAECPGGLDWAWYGLGECIRDTRDKISIAFGVLSIAAWFAFGFPQIVTNCVKKIPDIAVSPYLLGFWLVGDTLNFIGSFLTNQLFLQVQSNNRFSSNAFPFLESPGWLHRDY